MTDAVVAETVKKAAVAWVAVGDTPPRAMWCTAVDDALAVVSGPGEQQLPGLAEAAQATVRLRGDHGGLVVAWTARVTRVPPGTPEWDAVAPQLAGKRLNAPGGAAETVARWVGSGCAVLLLTPTEDAAVTGSRLPDDDGAATPRDTPVRVAVRRPFRLHRVRRR